MSCLTIEQLPRGFFFQHIRELNFLNIFCFHMSTQLCSISVVAQGLLWGPWACAGDIAAEAVACFDFKDNEDSWFLSLFIHKVAPQKDAHSTLLSKEETSNLYKIQFHGMKPECLDAYNSLTEAVLPKPTWIMTTPACLWATGTHGTGRRTRQYICGGSQVATQPS